MDITEAESKVKFLRDEIARHEHLYRDLNAPQISDESFDDLLRELRNIETLYPSLASEDSPTRKIGNDLSSSFESTAHLAPMLSLDNVFDTAELDEFDARLRKLLGKEDETLKYCVEPKIDGAGISAVYIDGALDRLLTRGDGETGDDITRNAFVFKNLPAKLSGGHIPALLEIRGEAYMTRAEFERIRAEIRADLIGKVVEKKLKGSASSDTLLDAASGNAKQSTVALSPEELAEIEKKLPANPRNLAAGTMKLLDKTILASRELEAVFYSVGKSEGFKLSRQSDLPSELEKLGLPSVDWHELAEGAKGAFERISELEEVRSDFPYNTDGAVVKLDDCSLYSSAGNTSRAPRWAIAWKYRAERAETLLKNIAVQVGRTGVVTPVAELEPVKLSGSTVSRATLHNAGYIAAKDIRVGDTVLIEKAGEIIPAVLQVVLEKRPPEAIPFAFPKNCPECGSPLKKFGEKMLYRCPNLSCPPQVRGRLEHFASRDCMDIRGLGAAVVDKLVGTLGISDPSDIYGLTPEMLAKLPNFKEKSVSNLLNSIADSKRRELWRLIYGLGILEIGEQFAKDLAHKFKSLDALAEASTEEIKLIDGFGSKAKKSKDGESVEPVRALSVRAFFDDPHNCALMERLRSRGLNFTELEAGTSIETPFSGKFFALTGTLKSMGRSRAKTLIENFGGRIASSVGKLTDYLISAGEADGEKARKAKEFGTKILSEDDFLAMLQKASANDSLTAPRKTADDDRTEPQKSGQLDLF